MTWDFVSVVPCAELADRLTILAEWLTKTEQSSQGGQR